MSVKRDNINDRSHRDEKTNDIKKQILDAAPETQDEKAYRRTDTDHDAEDTAGASGQQTHENRENPLADQVPGHLGYNKRDNLINANVTSEIDPDLEA